MLLQKRIHEWSKGLPLWQRDLLRRLTLAPLTDADRADVVALLLEEATAPSPVPLDLSHLPAEEDEHGRIELRRIGKLRNVNSLSETETLRLQPGLNIIFGNNGTGKTGYGRLLRALCRTAEREDILPNVFAGDPSRPQAAELVVAVDGAEREFDIDLAAPPPPRVLSSIGVFDASCARVYLTKPTVIDYVPRALALLKALADAQTSLATGLKTRIDEERAALPALPECDPQTDAGKTVATLDAAPKALKQLFLTPAEEAELDDLERAAAALKADSSADLEAAARNQAAGTNAVVSALRTAAALLAPEPMAELARTRKRLDAAKTAERQLASRAFSDQPLPSVGDDAWQEMWKAAKRFAESSGHTFPSPDPASVCPLCQQQLDQLATTRLLTFEEFVRSDLRTQVDELERQLDALVRRIPDLASLHALVEPELRGAPEQILRAANAAVEAIDRRAGQAHRIVAGEPYQTADNTREVDLDLLEAHVIDQTRRADAQAALRDQQKQTQSLRRLAELKARKTVAAAAPDIETRRRGLARIATYEQAIKRLATQQISIQLRKLQEAAVTDRLRTAIIDELNAMTPIADRVEVVGQASKGETAIQLRLRDSGGAKVDRVFSSGEQAAVATAFFLAEAAVSRGQSAIVLDDPVASFDHDHHDYLATRLVDESTRRQVVLFTHDLAFLYYLQRAAEDVGVDFHGQTLERGTDDVGVVRDGLPTKAISPSRRRKELRRRLDFELAPLYKGKRPEYESQSDAWVTDLRKAYEQLIEEYVLAGVVRRWSQNVRVRQLLEIKWTPDLAKRIEQAIKQLAPKAHHEAVELYRGPVALETLEAMFAEFEAICDATSPKRDANAATIDQTLLAHAEAAAQSPSS